MGFLTRLFGTEQRNMPLDLASWTGPLFDGGQTAAGVTVTPATAMGDAVVYACVRVLREAVAQLPLIVYRTGKDGSKERALNHPLYRLLHRRPNPEWTSYEWRIYMMTNVMLHGNAFAEIVWDDAGRVAELWPLPASQMAVERYNGRVVYTYTDPATGKETPIPDWKIHHWRIGDGALVGQSPIRQQAETLGYKLAVREFGSRFFSNGARPGIVLEHPGKLSKDAQSRLRENWNEALMGVRNAHRVRVVEEGMKVTPLTIPPEEAQFLQTQQLLVSDICRIFRVPPHMVADLERATFSNIEELGLEFVTYSLTPWLVLSEQAIMRDLLRPEETDYFVEYQVDGLLRGDITARYNAYSQARQAGWLSVNEIRRIENRNPVEGGDIFLSPLNMTPVGEDAPVATPQRAITQAPVDGEQPWQPWRQLRALLAPIISDAIHRAARRICNDVRQGGGKAQRRGGNEALVIWWEEYIDTAHSILRETMAPTGATAREIGQPFPARAMMDVIAHWRTAPAALDLADPDLVATVERLVLDAMVSFEAALLGEEE